MARKALTYLTNWLFSSNRKPMIIRGARQVGKTWLVRELARLHNKKLIELNFENKILVFPSNFMRMPCNAQEINDKKCLVFIFSLFNKLTGKNNMFLSNGYHYKLYQENQNSLYYGIKSIIELDSDSDSD